MNVRQDYKVASNARDVIEYLGLGLSETFGLILIGSMCLIDLLVHAVVSNCC